MTTLAVSFFTIIFVSCSSEIKKNDATRFKQGVFEIPASKGYSKTIITRINNLQIEEYTSIETVAGKKTIKHIDTLYIKWKNNFYYTLQMKSPKNELDKNSIFVQITKVTDTSYNFTAKIGFSKFKQKGIVYKVQ